MSCKRQADVARLFEEWTSKGEVSSIEAHCAGCGDCTEARRILEGSRALLQKSRVELSRETRVAIQLGLFERSTRRFWASWLFLPAAVAALSLLFWVGAPSFRAPSKVDPGAIELAAGGVSHSARAELRALKPSRLLFENPQGEGRESFHLESGEVDFEVRPLAGLELLVSTKRARIRVVGTAFRVTEDALRTKIEVSHGIVEVLSLAPGSTPVKLSAGEQIEIGEPREPPGDPPTRAENQASEPAAQEILVAEERTEPIAPRRRSVAQPLRRNPQPEALALRPRLVGEASAVEPGAPKLMPPAIEPKAPEVKSLEPKTPEIKAPEPKTPEMKASEAKAPEPKPLVREAAPPRIDISKLILEADALRRKGSLKEAAALYARVAESPEGSAHAEEATFQRAGILHTLQDPEAALALLDVAATRFPRGRLGPERTALKARILLAEDRPDEAASLLFSAPSVLEIQILRTDAAEKLQTRDITNAQRLINLVLGSKIPDRLRDRAERIRRVTEKNGVNNPETSGN